VRLRTFASVVGPALLAAATLCAGQTRPLGAADSPPKTVRVFDARYLRTLDLRDPSQACEVWDTMHALAAVQGLANRQSPQLYVLYCSAFGVETDEFWLQWLRGEDGWLKDAEIVKLASLEEVVRAFRGCVKGLAVYDPEVPATSSLASTAAGCDDLLPVRFSRETNSVFALLTRKLGLPVRLWLVDADGTSKFTGKGLIPGLNEPSTGSAKNDAYRWAIRQYIDSGRCDARFAAYYIDAFWLKHCGPGHGDLHTLCNHDYFIARRGFFFDLATWGDETPVDDPRQPLGLDRQTFLQMMAALNRKAPHDLLKVGGFTPWAFKYTDHAGSGGHHEGVETEWEFARLISQFNGYMEADAVGYGAIANASFFAHYPLRDRYPQPNPKPSRGDWQRAGYLTPEGRVGPKLYVAYYAGDYDSPSWLYKAVAAFFSDPQRGQVPLGWAIDPNLADRAPQALAYAYRHATTNDFFIAGDSGAGYLNPRGLTERPDSKLPPALDLWTEHCTRHYQRWGMTITGFMLDGSTTPSTPEEFAAYRGFSPDGCGNQLELVPRVISGVPTIREWDMPRSAERTAAYMAEQAATATKEPRFLWARTILRPPSWHMTVSRLLRENYPKARVAVVDPYTFFGLIKEHAKPEPPVRAANSRQGN
jgi:hypothetical protein